MVILHYSHCSHFGYSNQAADSSTKTGASWLDREIDALVYKLYGLTEEKIAIVESATK
jgi:hypothetical protein